MRGVRRIKKGGVIIAVGGISLWQQQLATRCEEKKHGSFSEPTRDDRLGNNYWSRSSIYGTKREAFVASSQPIATQCGLEVLRKGGNAADAAIATIFVLNVVEPIQCGIGGDAFALYWSEKEKKVHAMNASGRSPKSLTLDKLKQDLAEPELKHFPPYHAHAVTVPGPSARIPSPVIMLTMFPTEVPLRGIATS